MCSGSEAGWYLRLIDFVYHSTLGLRVIKKKRRQGLGVRPGRGGGRGSRGVECKGPLPSEEGTNEKGLRSST